MLALPVVLGGAPPTPSIYLLSLPTTAVPSPTDLLLQWPLRFLTAKSKGLFILTLSRRVKLLFTRGHISLKVVLKGPNVILGLYKCNYSLTVKRELSAATR